MRTSAVNACMSPCPSNKRQVVHAALILCTAAATGAVAAVEGIVMSGGCAMNVKANEMV